MKVGDPSGQLFHRARGGFVALDPAMGIFERCRHSVAGKRRVTLRR
jgi:hypothetical protein